jgi:hypothetical protein
LSASDGLDFSEPSTSIREKSCFVRSQTFQRPASAHWTAANSRIYWPFLWRSNYQGYGRKSTENRQAGSLQFCHGILLASDWEAF